ncbi:MAG: sugar ABC transporter permease, partial [Rhizobiales bacterium]|nr:sugar ABC transporter permease [Hyphomicrobiales bacterium]
MSASALPAAPQARRRPGLRDDQVARWLMPAPAVLLLAGFTLWPLIQIVRLSFATVKPGREPVFVGLANYERFLPDTTF